MARQDARCPRLAEVEGVGPLTAPALVAAVGNAKEFRSNLYELVVWKVLKSSRHPQGECERADGPS